MQGFITDGIWGTQIIIITDGILIEGFIMDGMLVEEFITDGF